MFTTKKLISKKNIFKTGIAFSLVSSCFLFELIKTNPAAQSAIEFRWDTDPNYKKLKVLQTSAQQLDRSTYYFFLKKYDRKSAILKLTLKLPEKFKTKITSRKLKLCEVQIGGYSSRTRCKKNLPAVFEIDNESNSIDVFPNEPIPSNKKSYALVMKIFNPRRSGLYQVNAYSQSPGELPISLYLGSYTIEIE